ncbi:MAG: RecQ family ATP-dependent DNA helicase [Chloroflexota bacterium]|nr:RecQ family ATP-dependent DNA helicase [Chloroflexota bacterium]
MKMDALLNTLHTLFGYEFFRPGQRETIEALLDGKDVLCILPTGAGKSLTYQLTAHVLHEQGSGVTVVVSPLIALMKDQADTLSAQGWDCVGVLNSHVPAEEQDRTMERLAAGELCLLYVTPERLESEGFLQYLIEAKVALLAVDEAHCVSQWGEDFRPAFLRVDEAVYRIRAAQDEHLPVLALTATAPPLVREEIVEKLRLHDPLIVSRGFERDHLLLEVEHIADESGKWAALARRLGPDANGTRLTPPGIIYCATVRATGPIAEKLREWGWNAAAYHGQMDKAERQRVQESFMHDETQIVVATNAFGLGIDKRDIRFVLHWDLPGSPESYYQEAGRAARDGKPAVCLLFYHPNDRHLQAFFASNGGPSEEEVRSLWATLGRIYQDVPLPLSDLAATLDKRAGEVERLLRPLEEQEYLRCSEDGMLEVLQVVPPDALELPMTQSVQRQAYDQSRLRMMEAYALTTDCRHEFLLNYLGQRYDTDSCGHCDNCLSGSSIRQRDLDLPFAPGDAVLHPAWGSGTVQRLEGTEGVTILFTEVGYKTIALAVWQENPELLERVA